jgi:hypothetical protein
MKNDMVVVNVKITREERDLLKKITHSSPLKTTQNILALFIRSYIGNPNQFQILSKMGVVIEDEIPEGEMTDFSIAPAASDGPFTEMFIDDAHGIMNDSQPRPSGMVELSQFAD